MDKEYLQDYQEKEDEEFSRLVVKKIEDGSFDITKDKYPPDNRFQAMPLSPLSPGQA